jgi:hypothetical protein
MSRFYFDYLDAKRFLDPLVYFVGVHDLAGESHLSKYVRKSCWTNLRLEDEPETSETNSRVKTYETRTKGLEKGDVLVAKRRNGKASDKLTALAVGIVVGRRSEGTVSVAWVLPNITHEIPAMGMFGTISSSFVLGGIKDRAGKEMLEYVEKARRKFLRLNMNIEEKLYY